MQTLVAPSLLAADFGKLHEEIEMLNNSEASWLHLDVMDGRFVPNISYGFPVIEAAKKVSKLLLDVHLMILEPEKYIERFIAAGADNISVHLEACPHLHRTLQQIKDGGAKAGIALNPHTPINALEAILPFADYVNVMTVNPGFGGQKFITSSIEKVKQLRDLARKLQPDLLIEIDGGVDNTNAAQLARAGADVLVAGSYVFKHAQPTEAISSLIISQ
jgi:ribulose-phosphate 3-epimerase